jgi:hypothetical protein
VVAQLDNTFVKLSKKKTLVRLISYFLYEGRPLTTKGRWFNRVVFFFYKIQQSLKLKGSIDRPIFILGTGRSGSTMLGITLGMHDEVGFLNEPKALWSHVCDEEDVIGSYQAKPGKYYLSGADANSDMKVKLNSIIGCYLKLTGRSRLVDKYPELIFRTSFVNEIFPDAKFLFLYRNGWDTCNSIQRWSERIGSEQSGDVHDWWGVNNRKWNLLCDQVLTRDPVLSQNFEQIKNYTNHVHMAAVEWILTMKQGLALQADSKVDMVPVRYESYVADESYRDEILNFCALPSDTDFSAYCREELRSPRKSKAVELPVEIKDEFMRLMGELGYE